MPYLCHREGSRASCRSKIHRYRIPEWAVTLPSSRFSITGHRRCLVNVRYLTLDEALTDIYQYPFSCQWFRFRGKIAKRNPSVERDTKVPHVLKGSYPQFGKSSAELREIPLEIAPAVSASTLTIIVTLTNLQNICLTLLKTLPKTQQHRNPLPRPPAL